ncbi:Uroporphyrin-III C/tetrapyrrole (Corrin/Porphyrin) methyltransferase [Denitrovibrio acetiphilus DSM 12809]|uniref:Uroporphyrin-III C/tetrapyrrole (Corrin/Porphyrin) methyltransferase n=1 Tax=Denitrovibrio acetiphilus (strain DSM 12809 / NBRC 114555 / N2460) TaxID=522772 RepID=D4H3N8_DENA2|nr:SAM-dependent methyltransferase [Denitrovibrio acetiphilus]ADD69140.1 Uroporphyrin-III C/tetrapyrrole (Corrin/Porphyrin) methyltransferase [Denitrovibrio acetiphilus DSM 12809]
MPTIYVAGTDITGDYSNIPPHLKEIAAKCGLIIGEDRRNLGRFVAGADVRSAEQMFLNEHSLKREKEFLVEVSAEYENVLLISDAGTPCVADPGYDFINMAWNAGYQVVSIPGPSSITAALSVSGYFSESFYFMGFPPKENDQRKKFFDRVYNCRDTVVLLERPYVLHQLLDEVSFIDKKMSLSMNLGMPDEVTYRGTAAEILASVPEGVKAPFVLVISKKRFKED